MGFSASKSTSLVKSVCVGAVEKMQDKINEKASKPTAEKLAEEACSAPHLNKIGPFCHEALEEVAEFVLKETEKQVEGYANLDGESLCHKIGFHDDGKTATSKSCFFPLR